MSADRVVDVAAYHLPVELLRAPLNFPLAKPLPVSLASLVIGATQGSLVMTKHLIDKACTVAGASIPPVGSAARGLLVLIVTGSTT
jgi:hypothetical protein